MNSQLGNSLQIKRQDGQKKYERVNAYTHKPSFQQILTIVLFIIHLAMHCIFMIRPILRINNVILYFIWGVYFLLILFIGFDYCLLTCGDPVDTLLLYPDKVELFRSQYQNYNKKKQILGKAINGEQVKEIKEYSNPYRLKMCTVCEKTVKWNSYHCWTCKRCVEDMDHHCKYLNNCVGGKNYYSFFRLLSIASLYFATSIGIAVWVLVAVFQDQQIKDLSFTAAPIIVFIIYTVVVLSIVQVLLWFHCYISCCRKMTTVQYLVRHTKSNSGTEDQNSNNTQQLAISNTQIVNAIQF